MGSRALSQESIRDSLLADRPLRIAFVNDLGFDYGAGIAHRRQVQSFLLRGHDVGGVCYLTDWLSEQSFPVRPTRARGRWLGMTQLRHLDSRSGRDAETVALELASRVARLRPDLIIVGNLHGGAWPLDVLPALREVAPLVSYLHDCHAFTGRCAYPEECSLFLTGCDASCPTAEEHPALAKDLIAPAWRRRRELFGGSGGVPIATNSRWLLGMLDQAFDASVHAEVVHLGLDTRLFRPIEQKLARRLLGLPEDRFLVLSGAVNVADRRKGGAILQELVQALEDRADVVVYGKGSARLKGVRAAGVVAMQYKLPLLYSAVDLFVGTALSEAFGQSFMEAAACGTPAVGFRAGGIPEVAQHGVNARLVDEVGSVDKLVDEVAFFRDDREVRLAYGQAGRDLALREFSLERQYERWAEFLVRLPDQAIRTVVDEEPKSEDEATRKDGLPGEDRVWTASDDADASDSGWVDSLTRWLGEQPVRDGISLVSRPRRFAHEEAAYDRSYGIGREHLAPGVGLIRLLREREADFSSPALEIGCGTGALSLGLAREGAYPSLLLTDPSVEFLKIVRDKLEAPTSSRQELRFAVLRAEDIHCLPSGALSLIALRSTLHHVLDVPRFIRNASRLLCPGGVLAFEEPCHEGYTMMGAMAQFIPLAIESTGRALTWRQRVSVAGFVDTMRFYARTDVDKSSAEDKHVFRVDELMRSGADAGLEVEFVANRGFAHVPAPAGKGDPSSFANFFVDYLKYCMSFDDELIELIDTHFRRYCLWVDALGEESVPYLHGVFLCRKPDPPRGPAF